MEACEQRSVPPAPTRRPVTVDAAPAAASLIDFTALAGLIDFTALAGLIDFTALAGLIDFTALRA